MRFLFRSIFKILLMPLIFLLILLQMVFIWFASLTGWIFWILASICFFTACGMYCMGNYTGKEILETFFSSFIIFAIPAFAAEISIWLGSVIGFLMAL